MQFIDEAKIHISSGKGGNGSVSFRRERYVPRGGPDGGDGGNGANIIFKCSTNLNTLIDFRFQQHFKAENGVNGSGRNKSGPYGKDLIITVPFGTQIFSDQQIIADMMIDGEEFVAAKGGKGGLGNVNFKSSTNQAPKFAQQGEASEELWVDLKLKLLSDVGVIGLPNAGKSTFLSACTRAKPKIADYPFTTLVPQLGVSHIDDQEFVIADIPGLIENASIGKGLGDRFLKHIERCSTLLHLIDCSSIDVAKDYFTIRSELENYSQELSNKYEIIALSKSDTLQPEEIKIQKDYLQQELPDKEIFVISSATHDNLDNVKRNIVRNIKKYQQSQIDE